jgi:hypothetical protein
MFFATTLANGTGGYLLLHTWRNLLAANRQNYSASLREREETGEFYKLLSIFKGNFGEILWIVATGKFASVFGREAMQRLFPCLVR